MPGIRYVFVVEQGTLTAAQVLNKHQDRAKTTQSILNLFAGIDAGNWRAGRVEIQQGAGLVSGVAASQTVTYAASAGAQTITIGGLAAISFTAGATDAATVQNAIAAIQAAKATAGSGALLVFVPTLPIYNFNTAAVLTLWANTIPVANQLGTGMTIAVTGTGATAGGATFTGGVNAAPNGFST
jgi:hypothetical protein